MEHIKRRAINKYAQNMLQSEHTEGLATSNTLQTLDAP